MECATTFVSTVLAKIAEGTVEALRHQMSYLVHHGSNIENLKNQVKVLGDARDDVEIIVEQDERKGLKILPTVKHWMGKVDEIIKEADRFLKDEYDPKTRCVYLKANHHCSRKATKLALKVVEVLQEKDKFPNKVAYDGHAQETWSEVSKDYQTLASRISLVENIMNEFKTWSVIGVYGIGGVGKTTLAKDVAREAKKHKCLFDDVALVLDVKQNPKLGNIQKMIAESLDLEFPKDQTVDNVANRLFNRMKDKKVLVIFDDVWEEIDLEKLGLHSGGCKILMTSRSGEVLSSRMGIKKIFLLDILDEEETWRLFVKVAGDEAVNDYKIKNIAKEVAYRCGGQPMLIVIVAGALRNKTSLHQWRDIWRRLKNFDGKEVLQEKAYSSIEWSYNQLDDEEAKKLFLFCASLAHQYFSINHLLPYSIGMNLFKNVHTVQEAQDRLHTLVDKLKDSSLLLDNVTSHQSFKIHDLVREVGISIGRKDHNILSIGPGQELREWPDNDFLENCTMIFFHVPSAIYKIPKRLECPKLEFLAVYNYFISNLQEISNNFFEEIKTLKVLDLTSFKLPLLPSSFVSLTNLKTLCLDHSVLGDISLVGQLRNLEILSFADAKFKQLPKEMGQLTHLRLLDLSYCPKLEVIAPNVLSSMTSLEELKMINSFNGWETEGNASLSELKKLSHLATLEIHIPNVSLIPTKVFSHKLENFKILIGDTWDWSDVLYEETSKNVLKLKLVRSNQLDQGLKRLLTKSEILYLDEMESIDNIFPQLDSEGFQYLKHLHIQNNSQISYVILSLGSRYSNINAFPILESLILQNLSSIEQICSDQLNFEPFKSLRSIKVQNCPNLKRLFSFSIVKCLSQLEEMEVVDCNIMEDVVGREKEENDHLRNKADVNIQFNKMSSLALQSLPKLVGFSSKVNTTTRTKELSQINHDSSKITEEIDVDLIKLFNGEVLLPSLETLSLCSITSNILWDDQLSTSSLGWVQNLKTLEVSDCVGLKFLLSSSMARSMVQLKHLEVRNCETLTEIVSLNQGDCAVIKEVELFGKLEYMSLIDLPNLVSFSSTNQYSNFQTGLSPHYPLFDGMVQFPSLIRLEVIGLIKVTTIWHNKLPYSSFCASKEVRIGHCQSVDAIDKHHHAFLSNLNSIDIWNCPNLKNVIPASLAGSLQGLERLVIVDCGALEEILMKEEEQETNQLIMFVFPKVKFMQFLRLPELRSFYWGMHSSKWPSLTHLQVVLGCNNNKVQILAKEHSSFQEKRKTDNPCDPMKQPLFLIEKESFPNLKKLTLSPAFEVYDDPITAACLSRVKDVVFVWDGFNTSSIFLSNCFRYFHSSFEGLTLENANNIEQEFVNDNHGRGSIAEHNFGTPSRIKALRVSSMNCLTHLWKDNSQPRSAVLPVLPNLELLYVSHCSRLKSIVSSAISFCNLTHLLVEGCNELKYLVTYQVAKSLTQLKIMSVQYCKGMVVIVESNDGDDDDGYTINNIEIVFGKLRYLELISLTSLRGFCSKSDHCCIKVPCLKTLMVNDCNIELKISEEGELLQYDQFNSFINETMMERDIPHGISCFIWNDETLREHSKRLLAKC